MKKFLSYILVMFMILFFIFRTIVAMETQLGDSFLGVTSSNLTIDIIMLFLSIVCVILIIKRNLFGALIYLVGYGAYLGPEVITNIQKIANSETLEVGSVMTVFTSIICLLLAIVILIDVLIDQKQKINPKDKKTDWFFKNEQFDRKYDERADRNHYKDM